MQIEHEATTAVLYLLAIRGTWISFTDSRKRYHATVPYALARFSFAVQWNAFQREKLWIVCKYTFGKRAI